MGLSSRHFDAELSVSKSERATPNGGCISSARHQSAPASSIPSPCASNLSAKKDFPSVVKLLAGLNFRDETHPDFLVRASSGGAKLHSANLASMRTPASPAQRARAGPLESRCLKSKAASTPTQSPVPSKRQGEASPACAEGLLSTKTPRIPTLVRCPPSPPSRVSRVLVGGERLSAPSPDKDGYAQLALSAFPMLHHQKNEPSASDDDGASTDGENSPSVTVFLGLGDCPAGHGLWLDREPQVQPWTSIPPLRSPGSRVSGGVSRKRHVDDAYDSSGSHQIEFRENGCRKPLGPVQLIKRRKFMPICRFHAVIQSQA